MHRPTHSPYIISRDVHTCTMRLAAINKTYSALPTEFAIMCGLKMTTSTIDKSKEQRQQSGKMVKCITFCVLVSHKKKLHAEVQARFDTLFIACICFVFAFARLQSHLFASTRAFSRGKTRKMNQFLQYNFNSKAIDGYYCDRCHFLRLGSFHHSIEQ